MAADKKPMKKQTFTYTLVRRICVLAETETETKYGKHDYITCLDLLDFGRGRGARYYIARYSREYKDTFGNNKLLKSLELSEQELKGLAAALASL